MNDEDYKEIETQAQEAIYTLKTISIKNPSTLEQEVRSVIYKAYVTGKTAGNEERFDA